MNKVDNRIVFSVNTEEMIPLNVRVIRLGEYYGLNDQLIHNKEEPLIEFFDKKYQDTENGKFINVYDLSIVINRIQDEGESISEEKKWLISQFISERGMDFVIEKLKEVIPNEVNLYKNKETIIDTNKFIKEKEKEFKRETKLLNIQVINSINTNKFIKEKEFKRETKLLNTQVINSIDTNKFTREARLLNLELINSVKERHSFYKTEGLIKQLKDNITITDNQNPLIELMLSINFYRDIFIKNILETCSDNNPIFSDPNLWNVLREKQQDEAYITLKFSQRFKDNILKYDKNYLKNIINDNYTYGFLCLLDYADIQKEMCKNIDSKNLVIELIKNNQVFLFKEYLKKYKDLMIIDNNNLFLSIVKLDMDKYLKSTYIDILVLYCQKNSEMFKNKQEILKTIKESNLADTCKKNILSKLDIKEDNLINKIIYIREKEGNQLNTKIVQKENKFKEILKLIKATIKKLFNKKIKKLRTNNVISIEENLKNENISIELKNEIIEYINIVNELKNSKIILNNSYEKDLSMINNKLENIITLNNKKEIIIKIKTNTDIQSEISNIENENILFTKLIKELKENIIIELKQNIKKDLKVNKKLSVND